MDVEAQSTKYRGKLYTLSADNAWEDAGVGYASVEDFETEGGPARKLLFRDEETHKILHDRPVLGKDAYQLQGEETAKTIIVWEDAEVKKDWAVSFQNAGCAKEIWEALRGKPLPGKNLPVPKFGNLQEICRLLTCVPPSQREAMAMACMAPAFLAGLRDAFHTAEDLGSEEALTAVWQIISSILLLSNQALTERYLKQDVYEDVFGMLEYDVGLPLDKRIAHRQVLKGKVQFRSVGAFEDADMLERIHLNYRLQYLKDCVLPRLLDDGGFVSLTQLIHGNLSVILDHLQKSTPLLERVFVHIRRNDAQSLMFLQDACRHARQVPPAARQALYERMTECKLFETLAPLLKVEGRADGLQHAHHAAIEVLCLSTANDASHLRRFLVNGDVEGQDFLTRLIRLMLTEEDQGVQGQIADTLKTIMDITTLEQRDRDRWLEVLYDRGPLEELVTSLTADRGRASGGPSALFGQQLLCEIMAFAVAHHGYRAKTFIVRHGFAQHTMRLVAAPMRFVQLAPLRLLRALVGTKDDGCHRYITKSRLFVPVMRSFQQSVAPPALGSNMMVSAVLELLEFIRTENIKVLVDHICKRHEALLKQHSSRFGSLRALMLRHQQNQELEAYPPDRHSAGGPMSRAGASVQPRPSRTRSPGRDDSDEEEEAYFDSLDDEDDEDDANAPRGSSRGGAARGSSCAALAPAPAPAPAAAAAPAGAAGVVGKAPTAGVAEPSSLAGVNGLEGLLGHYQDEDSGKRDPAGRGAAEGQKAGNRKRSVDLHGKDKVDSVECEDAAVAGANDTDVEAAAPAADACGVAAEGIDVKACATAAGALKRQGQADEEGKAGPAREELPRPGGGPGDAPGEDLRGAGGHLLREEGGAGSVASGPGGAEATGSGPGLPEDHPAAAESKVLTEKSLNHVSKRLKTSAASAAV